MDDKHFYQQFSVLVVFMIVTVAVILIIARLLSGGPGNISVMQTMAIEERIKPLGSVFTGVPPVAKASAPGSAVAAAGQGGAGVGKSTYEQVCAACHVSGVAGAPKFGDKAAWEPRIATGMGTLYKAALEGLNAMPAKGGRTDLPDADIKAAVDYMVQDVHGAATDAGTGNMAEKKVADAGSMTEKKVADAGSMAEKKVADAGSMAEKKVAGAGSMAKKKVADAGSMAEKKVAAAAPTTAAGGSKKGKETYTQTCSVCHAAGIAGAPKFGDKVAWQPRIATGMAAMYKAALEGLNAMPPKGGRTDLPDADVKAAVDYMVKAAQ